MKSINETKDRNCDLCYLKLKFSNVFNIIQGLKLSEVILILVIICYFIYSIIDSEKYNAKIFLINI